MIDTKIFALGATSISVEVSKWKSDGVTPAMYRCRISTFGGGPDSIIAERDTALQAERECTESYINYFKDKKRKVHPATINMRDKEAPEPDKAGPSPSKPAKKRDDDFEY